VGDFDVELLKIDTNSQTTGVVHTTFANAFYPTQL